MPGLSMFGVEVVKHLNDIGMQVDVSHCGHLTTMDACRHSKKPVNANHTSARACIFIRAARATRRCERSPIPAGSSVC